MGQKNRHINITGPTFFGLLEAILFDDIQAFKENLTPKTLQMHDVMGITPMHLLVCNPSENRTKMMQYALKMKGADPDIHFSSHYEIDQILLPDHQQEYLAMNDYIPHAYIMWKLLPKNGLIEQDDNILTLAEKMSQEDEAAQEIHSLLIHQSQSGKHVH